jgi:hypothetical protein
MARLSAAAIESVEQDPNALDRKRKVFFLRNVTKVDQKA